MMTLGHLGLGDAEQARAARNAGLALAPNHYGLLTVTRDATRRDQG